MSDLHVKFHLGRSDPWRRKYVEIKEDGSKVEISNFGIPPPNNTCFHRMCIDAEIHSLFLLMINLIFLPKNLSPKSIRRWMDVIVKVFITYSSYTWHYTYGHMDGEKNYSYMHDFLRAIKFNIFKWTSRTCFILFCCPPCHLFSSSVCKIVFLFHFILFIQTNRQRNVFFSLAFYVKSCRVVITFFNSI